MRNDALGVVSELAASPNNVFSRAQAASQGLTHRHIKRCLDAGLLCEPWPGSLVALGGIDGPSWLQLIAAATLPTRRRSNDLVVASHRSAARLHRSDGLVDIADLDVSVERPAKVRLYGIVAHRVQSLDRRDLAVVDGVQCTNLARTLVDLGSVCEPDVVERAFDDAVRRKANLRWLRETALRLNRPGTAGSGIVLDLLHDLEHRGEVRGSWFEKTVELCLDDPELGTIERQYRLKGADGFEVARFDLAVPDARLGIEAHSRSHHFGEENEASDEQRDHEAARVGWDVMYLGYFSTQRPKRVAEMVLDRVRSRRELLGVPQDRR